MDAVVDCVEGAADGGGSTGEINGVVKEAVSELSCFPGGTNNFFDGRPFAFPDHSDYFWLLLLLLLCHVNFSELIFLKIIFFSFCAFEN